jgi:hypothetical protein
MDVMGKPVKALVGRWDCKRSTGGFAGARIGMDEAGLRQLAVTIYITVGAADSQTPPEDNAVPRSCIAPGIDRSAIHRAVGAAAQHFFDAALGVTRQLGAISPIEPVSAMTAGRGEPS